MPARELDRELELENWLQLENYGGSLTADSGSWVLLEKAADTCGGRSQCDAAQKLSSSAAQQHSSTATYIYVRVCRAGGRMFAGYHPLVARVWGERTLKEKIISSPDFSAAIVPVHSTSALRGGPSTGAIESDSNFYGYTQN